MTFWQEPADQRANKPVLLGSSGSGGSCGGCWDQRERPPVVGRAGKTITGSNGGGIQRIARGRVQLGHFLGVEVQRLTVERELLVPSARLISPSALAANPVAWGGAVVRTGGHFRAQVPSRRCGSLCPCCRCRRRSVSHPFPGTCRPPARWGHSGLSRS